jgi:Outer membrane protein beta-barrel domain
MKKLMVVAGLLIINHGWSQDIHIGIKAGVVFAGCTIEYADASNKNSFSLKAGPEAGIFLDIPVSKKISFRPGGDLVRKGTKENVNDQNGGLIFPYRIPFTYIDFSLNMLYGIDNKKGKLMLGAGPVIGFRLNNHRDLLTKDPDLGAGLVAIYQTPLGFLISLNYTNGFNNLTANKDYITVLKNHYWGLSLGYIF